MAGVGKVLQKNVSRTKEKMMQSLGKSDRTTDQEFDSAVSLFTEQQNVAMRLNTEYKNYVKQVKALMTASDSMHQAIREAYESQWPGSTMFNEFGEILTLNWSNYTCQLDEAQIFLTNYTTRFQELKQKISKRNRKQTDYDSARHNAQSLGNAKRPDSFKVTKAQNERDAAKQVYESLNIELLSELKDFYDSRVPTVSTYMCTFFEAEATFFAETSKIKKQLADAAKETTLLRPLPVNYDKQISNISSDDVSYSSEALSAAADMRTNENEYSGVSTNYKTPDHNVAPASNYPEDRDLQTSSVSSPLSKNSPESFPALQAEEPKLVLNGDAQQPVYSMPMKNNDASKAVIAIQPPQLQQVNVDVGGNQQTHSDVKIKYQVTTTFDYEGTDPDELSFKAFETLNIIDFDDPDDEEDGWLMGIRVLTGERGIIPENFTRRI